MIREMVRIKGQWYRIRVKGYTEDKAFSGGESGTEPKLMGYCDHLTKEIAVCDLDTHPGFKGEPKKTKRTSEKETLRHEIVHAFFSECGLDYSALQYEGPWSKNEEMVDWIAIVGPDIYRAWREAGAL